MRILSALLRRTGSSAIARPCVPAWLFSGLAALLLAVAPFAARADDDDLPGRVGRIAEFAGQLFHAPQDNAGEWAAIGINYPIASGDNLWVSGDGRAEIDYGGGQFRLAGDTNLHVSRLDDRQLALFVAQGRLIVRVRVLDTGDAAHIDTPNTQITLIRPGLYRIDVASDGQVTTFTVREGEGLIGLASGAQQALPGQSVTVTGTEPMASDIRIGYGVDGFDTWSANRDRRYERGRATAYVSRQMVGYAELDEHGTWESNPTYGAVWYPTAVAADWAPYRDGYWTTVGAWGLTWVDSAPWGYAPSHYGRWVRVGWRWAWCPGGYVARPHWAPALVGWYGGAGWRLAVNSGAPVYGWVPLGWGDVYQPWWRGCSHNCWSRYNRGFAVDVSVRPHGPPARYANMGIPGAMTAVAGATLAGRKPVQANLVPLPASSGKSVPPLLATAPIVPVGPSHIPAVRPGERGTPTPASVLSSTAWRAPSAGTPFSKPHPVPGTAAGTAPAPAGRGSSGVPSAFAPTTRTQPATTPPSGAREPSTMRGGAPSTATPVADNPPPAQTQKRRAPPDSPAQMQKRPVPPGSPGLPPDAPAQLQKRPVPPGSPTPPAVTPQTAGRPGNLGTGSLPAPAAAVAPGPAGRAGSRTGALPPPATAPLPAGRAVAAPPSGHQGSAPGAPSPAPALPAPAERRHAKPDEADAAKAGKPGDKNAPGGAPVPK